MAEMNDKKEKDGYGKNVISGTLHMQILLQSMVS